MKRLALITFIVGAALAILPVASASVLLDGSVSKSTPVKGVGASPADLALNQLYGTVVTKLTPAQFASIYNNGGDRLSPDELAAIVARGQGLESMFSGTDSSIRPDVRGDALNQLYGNAVTKLTPDEFAAIYNNGGDRLSADELAATVARGQGLDDKFGVTGISIRPDIRDDARPTVSPASGGTSFDWDTTLGATLGAMLLLAAAATMVTRRRHQISV